MSHLFFRRGDAGDGSREKFIFQEADRMRAFVSVYQDKEDDPIRRHMIDVARPHAEVSPEHLELLLRVEYPQTRFSKTDIAACACIVNTYSPLRKYEDEVR